MLRGIYSVVLHMIEICYSHFKYHVVYCVLLFASRVFNNERMKLVPIASLHVFFSVKSLFAQILVTVNVSRF